MSRKTPSQACLRAIRAVINAGSYAAAARELKITHAAIAQQIRGFETKNGIKLFEKEWGRLQPTPLCIDIAEAAERMHEAEMDVARLISRRNLSGQFHLRVGLGNAMPGMAIIHHIIKMHPKLSVTVESGSHQEILGYVLRRQVDVGILPDILPDARFRRQTIIQQEVVAIVSDSHLLAKYDSVSLTTLIQEPLIFRSRGSSTQKVIDRAFGRIGLTPEPRLIADTRDAVYEAVSLGAGVGFMWRHGTHRADAVRRLAIDEITSSSEEVIFALENERNPLVDLFFRAGESYIKDINSSPSLDVYGRYLWTHMNSDSVTVGNDRLHFDSATSNRMQIGGRYNYAYSDQFKPYIGAAYEYEFSGGVGASAYNLRLDAPSLKGSTGIIEAGFSFTPNVKVPDFSINVTAQGFFGQRRGGSGEMKIKYQF